MQKMEKRFRVERITCSCRSYDEYLRMFDIDENDLKSRKILDYGAGAASFTAELLENGHDAVATDILYDIDPDTLEWKCKSGLSRVLEEES